MSKLNLILVSGLVLGVAACGDDVTVTPPPEPPPPGIRSVSVAPDGATITAGQTLQFSAAVVTDPGAPAVTVAWSTSAAAAVGSISGTGLFTSVAAAPTTAVSITATATAGTSTGSGNATLNIQAAPTCQVSSVTITPAQATLVTGQTLQLQATVNGTGPCAQSVTWNSLSPNIASVGLNSGLVTANSNNVAGNAVIVATSTADPTKSGAMSVEVIVPTPAAISIQSLTAGGVPVVLSNVFGQIEVALNVERGDRTLERVDILIDGQVVASQGFAQASAQTSASGVPETVVLNVATDQVRMGENTWAPVVFNGGAFVVANLYVAETTTPLASQAVPVVMNNPDHLLVGDLDHIPLTLDPEFTDANSNVWHTGNTEFSGPIYLAYSTVVPTSVVWANNAGSAAGCSATGTLAGSAAEGLIITNVYACTGEGTVFPASAGANIAYTPFPAPAGPDGSTVTYPVPSGGDNPFSALGATFELPVGLAAASCPTGATCETRRFIIPPAGAAPSLAALALFIDNLAPIVTFNPVGFLAGTLAGGELAPFNCEETGITPGCWINNAYSIADQVVVTDGGSGALGGNAKELRDYTGGLTCAGAVLPTGTGADYAETTVANDYTSCAIGSDPLGNSVTAIGANATRAAVVSNGFSVDNTPPTLVWNGDYTFHNVVDPDVVDALPAQFLDYLMNDDNSGLDTDVALSIVFTRVLNSGGVQSSTACAPPAGWTMLDASSPRQMATPVDLSAGGLCALPGERRFATSLTDRAGNTTGPLNHQLEFNPPGAEVVNAVNILPLYAANTDASFDIFASDDEDLAHAQIMLPYVTSSGAAVNIVFGPAGNFFTNMFGQSWDGSLYLNTPASGQRLTLPAAYNLTGYADDAAALPGSTGVWDDGAVPGISFWVFDTFGTMSPNFDVVINPAFKTAASWSTTNPWTAPPNTSAEAATIIPGDASSCAWTYQTPTNNPAILNRIWAANFDAVDTYTIIVDIQANPILVSDDGLIRTYRHNLSNVDTCVNLGINQIIPIESNVAWLGYPTI